MNNETISAFLTLELSRSFKLGNAISATNGITFSFCNTQHTPVFTQTDDVSFFSVTGLPAIDSKSLLLDVKVPTSLLNSVPDDVVAFDQTLTEFIAKKVYSQFMSFLSYSPLQEKQLSVIKALASQFEHELKEIKKIVSKGVPSRVLH